MRVCERRSMRVKAPGVANHAADAAFAYQQIAAQPDPVNSGAGRHRAQECGQILEVARREQHIGRSNGVP